MPRVSVSLDPPVLEKLDYVRREHSYDRSLSAVINRAVLEFLKRFPDPPPEQEPPLPLPLPPDRPRSR